jgi:hypothetical protein
MRFGRAACKAHFGNQQLTHHYKGEVKGRATDDKGVTTVSVLWNSDSTEVESNEKHVAIPTAGNGEPYEFDEGASIKAYEDNGGIIKTEGHEIQEKCLQFQNWYRKFVRYPT